MSIPSITGWYWQFGDGSTSSSQTPTHTYTSRGLYKVSLTVYPSGASPTTKTNFVRVGPSSFISGYSWSFGDGSGSVQQNPTHVYTSYGVYKSALTIFENSGVSVTRNSKVIVGRDFGNPTYYWNFGDSSTGSGASISHQYSDVGMYAPTLSAIWPSYNMNRHSKVIAGPSNPTYSWVYGDGGSGIGSSVSYIYSLSGIYLVELTMTDWKSDTSTTSGTVIAILDFQPYNTYQNSAIQPILSNCRLGPYRTSGDYLNIKTEIYNRNNILFAENAPVSLYVLDSGYWYVIASGYTNRYGVCRFKVSTNSYSFGSYASGMVMVEYRNAYYCSNLERFNFI
jgi:PKD repeat protein